MSKRELPCSCCCKHLIIEDDIWDNGGIVTCKFCGYKTKFMAHKPITVVDPDTILLKRKYREATQAEKELLVPKPKNPLTPILKWYDKLNPKPHIAIRNIDNKPAVEVGIRISF